MGYLINLTCYVVGSYLTGVWAGTKTGIFFAFLWALFLKWAVPFDLPAPSLDPPNYINWRLDIHYAILTLLFVMLGAFQTEFAIRTNPKDESLPPLSRFFSIKALAYAFLFYCASLFSLGPYVAFSYPWNYISVIIFLLICIWVYYWCFVSEVAWHWERYEGMGVQKLRHMSSAVWHHPQEFKIWCSALSWGVIVIGLSIISQEGLGYFSPYQDLFAGYLTFGIMVLFELLLVYFVRKAPFSWLDNMVVLYSFESSKKEATVCKSESTNGEPDIETGKIYYRESQIPKGYLITKTRDVNGTPIWIVGERITPDLSEETRQREEEILQNARRIDAERERAYMNQGKGYDYFGDSKKKKE